MRIIESQEPRQLNIYEIELYGYATEKEMNAKEEKEQKASEESEKL